MKFGWIVENRKVINFVLFNRHVTSLLRHNDTIVLAKSC